MVAQQQGRMRYLVDQEQRSSEGMWLLGVDHRNEPECFYLDFVSRIWLTYRSHLAHPITTTTTDDDHRSRWQWTPQKSWSSDAGWGCMLRTGQSLLANALVHARLSRGLSLRVSPPFHPHSPHPRDWRRPPCPLSSPNYATYVQILTWFFDSPQAPFSVHRMALAGKHFGTQVGQWFGPSVAAGALQYVLLSFISLFLSLSLTHTLSLPDASSMPFHTLLWALPSPKTALSPNQTSFSLPTPTHTTPFPPLPPPLPGATDPSYSSSACAWASTVSIPSTTKPSRQVLPLLFYRLSSHHHPQFLFTFPQCIGIAGGRPSSSYYFVGSQADNLFYLDPHHPRPAIPLRSPPSTPAQDHPSLTPLQQHLVSAYSDAELKTYHCDKVRKMPLRGLDPSMLLGFLCKTSQEWDDLRNRVEHVRRERLVR